ncbi:MAG: hypothetical protein GF417_03085 [Candidatus Latescibacteria bacterium]|nr:hypothetical protein [bacterium]MBD3423413.1 hypothetical protein [Candidatus Latescibacterota bacterium]
MSFKYVKINGSIADEAGCGAREGDRLFVDTDRRPGAGDLVLVAAGGVKKLRRWSPEPGQQLVGTVIALKRKL